MSVIFSNLFFDKTKTFLHFSSSSLPVLCLVLPCKLSNLSSLPILLPEDLTEVWYVYCFGSFLALVSKEPQCLPGASRVKPGPFDWRLEIFL